MAAIRGDPCAIMYFPEDDTMPLVAVKKIMGAQEPITKSATGLVKFARVLPFMGIVVHVSYETVAYDECLELLLSNDWKSKALMEGRQLAFKMKMKIKNGVAANITDGPFSTSSGEGRAIHENSENANSQAGDGKLGDIQAKLAYLEAAVKKLESSSVSQVVLKQHLDDISGSFNTKVQELKDSVADGLIGVANSDQECDGLGQRVDELKERVIIIENRLEKVISDDQVEKESGAVPVEKTIDELAADLLRKFVQQCTEWRAATGKAMDELFTFEELTTSVPTERGAQRITLAGGSKPALDPGRVLVLRKFVEIFCHAKKQNAPEQKEITGKMFAYMNSKCHPNRKRKSADPPEVDNSVSN